MGLVLNELITNAFKYAFADGRGKLTCRSERRDGKIYLQLGDDGPGLSAEIDPLTTRTLGFKLIRDIVVMQLKGSLEVDGDNGTTVSIIFPVDAEGQS
jgi:two-component sensor histidine kinase